MGDIREREINERRGSDDHGRQLMNVHNNEAGRRAVIKNMKVTCKCHGVSGSCSLVTCWQQLAPFRKVGDYLREKYDTSTMVKVTRRGRLRVRNGRDTIPTANDLEHREGRVRDSMRARSDKAAVVEVAERNWRTTRKVLAALCVAIGAMRLSSCP